jgi:hypothetical protein
MRHIETSVEIARPPVAVWRVLTDFPSYPAWNPFIRRIEGDARVGARLRVTVQPPGRKPMTFQPTVRAAEPARELRWLGRVLIPGLFDGEHAFVIEPVGGGCLLRHEERFTGLLAGAFPGMLADTAKGFEAHNAALKRQVESAARGPTAGTPG